MTTNRDEDYGSRLVLLMLRMVLLVLLLPLLMLGWIITPSPSASASPRPKNSTQSKKLRAQWAADIRAIHKQTVQGILEMGRTLMRAKAALAHGEFELMIKRDLPFDASTAERLMKIARDPRLRVVMSPSSRPNPHPCDRISPTVGSSSVSGSDPAS